MTSTRPPVSAFVITFIVLAAICLLLAGCAQIPFERTYSFGYGKASGSVTLRPLGITGLPQNTLYHEGKTIVPLHPAP
jgi:hypothetical protein